MGRSLAIGVFLLATVSGCRVVAPPPTVTGSPQDLVKEGRILVDQAVLEQADNQGKPLWRVRTDRAVYSKDRQEAKLSRLVGNLFEKDQVVLKVQADRGFMEKNGASFTLEGNVLVEDLRHRAVFRGEWMQWQPDRRLIVLDRNFRVRDPQWQLQGRGGRYQTDRRILTANGNLLATAAVQGWQWSGETLIWNLPAQTIVSDRPTQVKQFNPQTKGITMAIQGQNLKGDLVRQVFDLGGQVRVDQVDPPLKAETTQAIWRVKDQTITLPTVVTIVETPSGIRLTGQRGQVNLAEQTMDLTGGIRGTNPQTQAQLTGQRLLWTMKTQKLEVQGQVSYQQQTPFLALRGDRLRGDLRTNQFTLSGSQPVVSEIIP